MSDDYYEDVWEEITVTINIDAVTQVDLERIQVASKKCLISKLEKLNVVLKNLDVYCYEGVFLVNDSFGICKELPEIARAFGFTAETVDCGLKGKSYLIHDTLFELIKVLDPNFEISQFASKQTSGAIHELLRSKGHELPVGSKLQEALRTILHTGQYSIEGKQRILSSYINGFLQSHTEGEVVSDREEVTNQLRNYLEETQTKLKAANTNLQNGTVKLLYHRARQMGYAVKEERKGTQVQLVLVRAE